VVAEHLASGAGGPPRSSHLNTSGFQLEPLKYLKCRRLLTSKGEPGKNLPIPDCSLSAASRLDFTCLAANGQQLTGGFTWHAIQQ